MSQHWRTRHQTIVVVDVAGFTNPARILPQQLVVHAALYRLLRHAFAESGVDLANCHMEDRGDGAMILLPSEVAPPSLLTDQLTSRLVAGLRRHNALYSAGAAMQLRVALHAGEVHQYEDGVVSPAVNLAFRILEAPEAKAELKSSAGVLALIASESFYRDVIVQDPAAEPGSYRQIQVSVKETSTSAWLRLPDRAAASDTEPLVLELFPATEVQRLREWLAEITIPQLRTLVQQAGGPGVFPAMSVASAWEAFSHLAEFNAGADGFPPALTFVELVAHQVGGDVGAKLTEWSGEQARRLRLDNQLSGRRAAGAARIPVEPRLHLMIVVQHDGIDPDRYLLSYWRQDDPSKWPPPRGETRMVRFEELERRVDDLVVSAERAWSGHAGAVALEFVLPRTLLNLPVHRWHKEHDSGEPRPLCLDYPVVVRSLERMQASHWHRVWRLRWQTLMNDPSAARVHICQSADLAKPHRMDALLSEDPQLALMVLTSAPSAQPRPGADELGAALRSGLPALVWHPEGSSAALQAVLARLVEDDGLGDMPGRAQALRRADFHAAETPSALSFTHGLVVLWDNPHRVVTFDQPPDIPQPRGEDTSDERERAS